MKNKNTALLFACFTGFFTYLYTYNPKVFERFGGKEEILNYI
tara:strand:- start:1371 stop:1496 length:126 start_codon:yes stop_codon:yes gene_type:complete